MISSTVPTLVPVPFASGAGVGFINPIPIKSQIVGGSDPGLASMTDGFTPRTFTPEGSGGLPPRGQDFNGILNLHSNAIQWSQLGKGYAYNAAFQAEIGGYPKGGVLVRSDLSGGWISTAENNATNPEALGAGWLPCGGSTTPLTLPMTNASVTLTALQAASSVIIITGTLSANVNIVFPAWVGVQWLIINSAANSSAYGVTATTGSGSTVPLVGNTPILCVAGGMVGTSQPGRLLRTTSITTSQTFTPHPLATTTRVRGCGGGGSGGGCTATGGSQCAAAQGGSAASYAEVWFGKIASASVTIGAAGAAASGSDGGTGGQSTFGNILFLPGGYGGGAGTAQTPPFISPQSGGSGIPLIYGSTSVALFSGGAIARPALAVSLAVSLPSQGAQNIYGCAPGGGYGTGGQGSINGTASAANAGGVGTPGFFFVEEFA